LAGYRLLAGAVLSLTAALLKEAGDALGVRSSGWCYYLTDALLLTSGSATAAQTCDSQQICVMAAVVARGAEPA
jgi:hypothetical protein